MPTYTYSCSDCDWTADRRVSFRTSGEVRCPACGSTAEREQVYQIGVSGFAKTPNDQRDFREDYRRFNEATSELEYKHERLKDATQNENLAPPPLYKTAKARALDLAAKGATIDDL